MNERDRLKQEEQKVKAEEEGRYQNHQRRKLEGVQDKKQGDVKKRQQQQQQHADITSKLQTNLLKKQDELVQKQQDALQGSPKVTYSFTYRASPFLGGAPSFLGF